MPAHDPLPFLLVLHPPHRLPHVLDRVRPFRVPGPVVRGAGVRGVRAEAVVEGGDGGEVVGFVEEEGQGGEEGEGGYEGVPEGAAVDVAVAGRGRGG